MGSTPGREACSRHIQWQPGPWRGSRDLGLQTFRPWPDSLHPHRRLKAFRHRPQAGGPGPPGRCLDRRAATLNPFPRHHRLCRITPPSPPPTTAAGNRRPAGLPRIPVHRWGVLHPEPQTPTRDNAWHRVPHGPSGTGIPAETDPTPGTGHDLVAEGFPCVGMGRASLPTGPLQRQPGNPPRARPDSPPRTG